MRLLSERLRELSRKEGNAAYRGLLEGMASDASALEAAAPIETWIARCDMMMLALVEIRDCWLDMDDAIKVAAEALKTVADARPPVWTRTPPTEPGFYWVQRSDEDGWLHVAQMDAKKRFHILDTKIPAAALTKWEFSPRIIPPQGRTTPL